MEERHGALAENLRIARRVLAQISNRRTVPGMDRDEIGRPEKEVHVLRGKRAVAAIERDVVKDDVQISVVRFDLWILARRHRILDRERVKREGIAEDERLGNRRRLEIDPQHRARGRIQPAAVDARDFFRLAVAVDEDRDHVMADG